MASMRFPLHVFFLYMIFVVCSGGNTQLNAQAVGDYQSVGVGGTWNALATWNTWNGSAWVAPVATPTSANGIITISAGTTVTITAAVTIDDVVINGTLTTGGASTTTFANGAGVDITINGTLIDNWGTAAGNSLTWTVGATWLMGATGTLIKTTGSASNTWQTNYQGGITNIPATSNWIIRRTATAVPFSSTTPATGAVYPNLTIENNGGTVYTPAAAQSITGTTTFVTIKGNLDIGGAGTNVVDFSNNNTFATPTLVMGNMIVRTGNTWRNFGTGTEIRGDLIVNGTISYDANDGRKLIFSGGNNQTVSGTGTMNVWDMTLNKTAGTTVTLNRAVTVNNLMTFTSGVINTASTNLLIIASTGSVASASNASYVDGPIRYMGNAPFVFPVGENGDYQPIAHAGFALAPTIWSENFNNGCTSLCNATTYPGWTITNTGTNDASANVFYVSCAENGNAIGACGTGCGADATLHIANVSTSPSAFFFCPSGDCGAAFDAGLGSNQVRTSKRAESPTINCTGYYNVILSFKYMEGGSGSLDNALCWYFDGAVWTMIADMPKTATGCLGQGIWTAYSVALPASANNNPNVKIGFQWVNNDDGAGSDPSFAVDNVSLSIQEYYTAEYFHSDGTIPYGSTIAPSLQYISTCEYWILDRAPLTNTSTSVTLTWDANSCPVWAVSDLRVARYDGVSTWQDEGSASTTGTTAAGTITSNLVTSFSPFTLAAITTNPLPVVLTSFTAWYDNDAEVSQLEWTTSSEINNDYFVVERADYTGEFFPIGRIDGHGTTSQPNHYHFTDPSPLDGLNSYRLRQVDYNGQYEYSPIRNLYTGGTETLDILSVTALGGQIDISIVAPEGKQVQVSVVDVTGREVYLQEEVIHSQPAHFVTSQLSSGVYFINVSDGTRKITKKFQVFTE